MLHDDADPIVANPTFDTRLDERHAEARTQDEDSVGEGQGDCVPGKQVKERTLQRVT